MLRRLIPAAGVVPLLLFAIAFAAWGPRSARASDKLGSFNEASTTSNTTAAIATAVTATTQVLGLSGASLSYYLTDVMVSCGATASAVSVVSSTTAGNACATSPANVVPAINLPINGSLHMTFRTPIKVTANSALCCKTAGSTAFSCLVSGYIAP